MKAAKSPAPVVTLTDAQRNALKALDLAARCAKQLAPFHAPASILADETAGEHDDVEHAISDVAERYFGSRASLSMKRFRIYSRRLV